MKCPYCYTVIKFNVDQVTNPSLINNSDSLGVEVAFGFCPACNGMIILKREVFCVYSDFRLFTSEIQTEQIIYPNPKPRNIISEEVPERYKNEFNEAAAVLQISPKASAAISRRLLQDILRNEYSINKKSLDKEIEEFINKKDLPSYIAEDVDAIRNVGNFATHPLKDTNTGEIIDVEPGEAEWLLDVLEALYDFTFIQPKLAEKRREKLNMKLEKVGKSPMK